MLQTAGLGALRKACWRVTGVISMRGCVLPRGAAGGIISAAAPAAAACAATGRSAPPQPHPWANWQAGCCSQVSKAVIQVI